MSRRAAVVEEFDDDTDLPLPSMPLPNTGARGPILQELHDDSDEDDHLDKSYRAGPASPPKQQPFSHQWSSSDTEGGKVTDTTPYKTYVSDTSDDTLLFYVTNLFSDGHVYIPSTLMPSVHMEQAKDELLAPRACGGR